MPEWMGKRVFASMLLEPEELDRWCYHYTTRDTAIQHVLYNRTLKLSKFKYVNDPRENKLDGFSFPVIDHDDGSITIERSPSIGEASRLLTSRTLVLCMSKDPRDASSHGIRRRGFRKQRMWAQYAGNHTGVCLAFDRLKLEAAIAQQIDAKGHLFFGDVDYDDGFKTPHEAFSLDPREVKTRGLDDILREKVQAYHRYFFFLKDPDWSNECEWRSVFYGESEQELYIEFRDSLVAVFLGADFPEAYDRTIVESISDLEIEVTKLTISATGIIGETNVR